MNKIRNLWGQLNIGIRLMLSILGILLLVVIIEIGFQYRLLVQNERGMTDISVSEMSVSGYEQEGNLLVATDTDGSLQFSLDRYVDKLVVQYHKTKAFRQTVTIEYYNAYDKLVTKTIQDQTPAYLNETVINIQEKVHAITLTTLNDAGDLVIDSVTVKNQFQWNWMRMLFFTMVLLCLNLLVLFRKQIGTKAEYGFLIVALTAGIAMLVALPLLRVGYDEEVHLRSSFLLSIGSSTKADDTLWNMLNTSEENDPTVRTSSYEEYSAFYSYLNENANYYGTETQEHYTVTPRHTSGMYTFGYIFMALAMNLGRLLHLGFGSIYILARLSNLLMYTCLMFFAIKTLHKGKLLMAVLGLVPTAMFLASTVSYDTVVIGFLSLGCAYMINAYGESDKLFTWRQYLPAMAALTYGCLPKAVYAPLILLGLFLPGSRFTSKKARILMKSGMVLLFLILLASFVLPELLSPAASGDNRGGNTSPSQQMEYIFGHPIAYGILLLKSIGSNLFHYTIGSLTLDNLYFFGIGNQIFILIAIVTGVVLTHKKEPDLIPSRARVWMYLMIFAAVSLIWTALYLAYTEVGLSNVINGVQGRYYLPFLFVLLYLLPTEKIKLALNQTKYQCFVYLSLAGVLFFEIYQGILKISCF